MYLHNIYSFLSLPLCKFSLSATFIVVLVMCISSTNEALSHKTQYVYCAFCFQSHSQLKSRRSENKAGYFRMPFHLLCIRKHQTSLSFAVGYAKPWFKHPECKISNANEGAEIMAYLGGCIVYCVEVDLKCVGTSQENLQAKCESYQCRTGSCLAFWSRRH